MRRLHYMELLNFFALQHGLYAACLIHIIDSIHWSNRAPLYGRDGRMDFLSFGGLIFAENLHISYFASYFFPGPRN